MGAKWHVYPEMAAAGMWTTAGDLARFATEVQKSAMGKSNRVLDRSLVNEMLSPVGVGDFAVGFRITKEGEGWYFSHGGGNWGFLCTLVAHKSKGYGLAIMTNSWSGGKLMEELGHRIRRHYDWDSEASPVPRGYDPIPERNEIDLAEDILALYVGEYKLREDFLIEITLEDGKLFTKASGQPKFPVFPESETKFFLRVVDAQITFAKDDDGKVEGLILHQRGRDQRAKKIK